MAKSGKVKNKAPRKTGGKKKNPFVSHRRRKSNPTGVMAMIGSPGKAIEMGVAGLASAVATRQLPQLLLGTDNTGPMGYMANVATVIAATVLAGTLAGPAAGVGALVGGTVIVMDRVLAEQVSTLGPVLSLSGVGDPMAMTKLGTVRDGFYMHPNLMNPDGSMYIPDPITAAAVNAVVAKYPGISQPQTMAIIAQNGGPQATLRGMGAVNPSELRRHAAGPALMSSRFQGRTNRAA